MAGALLRGLAWPLLLLLHLAFSVFSLLLRITESFSHPEPTSRTSASVSPTVPHHVALCLPSRKSGTRRRNGTRENEQERKALVETLKRAVRWSIQDGVRELSVYSNIGWEGIPEELKSLTMTYSSSTSRTSSTKSSSSPLRRMTTPPDSLSSSSLLEEREWYERISNRGNSGSESESSSPTPTPRGTRSRRRKVSVLKPAPVSRTTTLILGDSRHGTVKLHLLPALDMAAVASKYAQSGTPPSQITVQSVDTDIRSLLGIENDPELLIIHPLTPLSPLRALLPRPAPQLSSYPFWYLRITEIYQTPQILPLVGLLAPLAHRLRVSSMPALVKIGFAMPLITPNRVRGALRREEWDGGLEALGKVEQRLGR